MIDSIIKDISSYQILRFTLFMILIILGHWLIKKAAISLAGLKPKLGKGLVPTVLSLLDWVTFYGVIILFLFSFSKTEWLFYPLYTHGEVEVTIFLIITAFLIVSLAHRLVKLFTRYVLSSIYDYYNIDKGLGYTLNQIIYYTVMFAALAISLTSVGLDLTALGAVLGVLGIGIGFGMRNVAGNFVSGIIILFERPIEVGEIIQIDNKIGRVEKIRLRSTVIRTAKEGVLIVPNQYFIEQIIKNRTSARMMAQVNISVAYGTDTQLVDSLLQETVKRVKQSSEGILDNPEPDIRFINFNNKAMDFLVEIPVINFEIKEQIESRLRHLIAGVFVEHQIKLPGFEIEGERNS